MRKSKTWYNQIVWSCRWLRSEKPRLDHQFSHAISKAQWGRHQRDSLIHRTWEIGERGVFGIKKTNSTSLPREAGERQKRFQMEINKRIRFQGQEQIVIGVLNVKTNSVFCHSELCRKGFGRIPFFPFFFFRFCSVICSVFLFFCQFAVPFFPFQVPILPLFPFPVPFVVRKFRKIRSLVLLWRVRVSGLRVQDFCGWGCQRWRFKVA